MEIRFIGQGTGNFIAESAATTQECLCEGKTGVYLLRFPDNKEIAVGGVFSPLGANNGCWLIGAQMADFEMAIPAFECRYEAGNAQSVALVVTVPEGTRLDAVNSD